MPCEVQEVSHFVDRFLSRCYQHAAGSHARGVPLSEVARAVSPVIHRKQSFGRHGARGHSDGLRLHISDGFALMCCVPYECVHGVVVRWLGMLHVWLVNSRHKNFTCDARY